MKILLNNKIFLLIISLVLLLIIFIFSNVIMNKAVVVFFISILLLYSSTKNFYIGFITNIILLIYLPFILIQNNHIFLNKNQTNTLIFILCMIFITSIFDFLILSYNINNHNAFTKYAFLRLINKYFLKTFCIFILYLTLLYSVLDSFAILYTYLGNVFNEGIVGTEEIFSHLDALYFSTSTFFTIGFGDIRPTEYSEITKRLVIIQAIISHLITTVLWPVAIIFVFGKVTKKTNS